MLRPIIVLACAAALGTGGASAQSVRPSKEIVAAIASPDRTPANRARDGYRHPAETLAFFGVAPTQTVVEFIPGGGWYTEILAPMLKGRGRYVAFVPTSQAERLRTTLAGKTAQYGATQLQTIDFKTGVSTMPAGTADVVVTFRNVHNLLMQDDPAVAARVFKAFHDMLKPGGVLGVVDHRLPEAMDTAREKSSGYLKRSTIIRLAQNAGFRLAGESEINANPKDTHDHPEGVWTLPPTYRLKDVDRAKYAAIGESDRLTLKFVKAR
ncbi:class I SAM-dependent methyltransferase [Sphingomonas ginsenosidivorax]|uniref:Class I SAM-dependent methyltransferase n=1 Tax=Sphingomonas ginsenosidivorax TaxID=862135 RepID=A0A5C6UE37_9SPHN|nr:class I SAM-dependent methyltransferase [Sphingomonas ginsenosidivorax]TXC71067.1 class I SAM-dependent methyltransferase [Sphingomonas ginsenosidivorax]